MSFEPYGVGIEREYASELGIQSVQYYSRDSDRPDGFPVWLTQSSGVKTDWRQEREYRYKGDFDFSVVPKDKLICFTRTRDQAAQLQNALGIRTIGFMA
jgi:NADH:ubiquinone oxidoreductase subunit D